MLHLGVVNEAREVIIRLTELQHGVVKRRELHEQGVGPRALRHQIDCGFVEPLSPQVLRLSGSPRTKAQQAMAGVLDAPGSAYLSHRSAAAWWKLPGFKLKAPVQVIIPWQGTNRRTRLSLVHYHRDLPQDHLLVLEGIPVVSPALLIFLLAGAESPARPERALDNALSMRLVSTRTVHSLLDQLGVRGRNGIAVMRRLIAERPVDYVPPQKRLEARVGRLARDVGLTLRRQVNVGVDEWIGRVDFEIEGCSDLIEVLSERYHSALLDRKADAERFVNLQSTGRRLLTIWDADVWSNPEQVRQQLLRFWLGRSTAGEQTDAPERGVG